MDKFKTKPLATDKYLFRPFATHRYGGIYTESTQNTRNSLKIPRIFGTKLWRLYWSKFESRLRQKIQKLSRIHYPTQCLPSNPIQQSQLWQRFDYQNCSDSKVESRTKPGPTHRQQSRNYLWFFGSTHCWSQKPTNHCPNSLLISQNPHKSTEKVLK